MHIGRFRRVGSVKVGFDCEACPIVIRRGMILHDSSRDLNLLTLTVSNRGNVTVDEIEVKVTSYDKNGNPIPEENGIPGQIVSLTDAGCLPDQTVGEGQLILLPSAKAVTCDVIVTRVRTAGDVELRFTEADYAPKLAPGPVIDVTPERNRRIFIGLMVALGLAAVLYLGLLIGGWYTETYALPANREKVLQGMLARNEYDAALAQLGKMEAEEGRAEEIVQSAISYYMARAEYSEALRFASKSEQSDMRYRTLCLIVDQLAAEGDYDAALRFATTQNSKRLVDHVYELAITYYTNAADFRTALTWVALSGIPGRGDAVWRAAVSHYAAASDPVTALEYAIKTGDETVMLSVYDDAIMALLQKQDYASAALYIARCSLADTPGVGAALKAEIYGKTDLNFIRTHIADFWPNLTFAQKQALYAKVLSIDTEVLALKNDGSIYGTADTLPTVSGVVSVALSPSHMALLLSDGTVVATGSNEYGQCDTAMWTNVIGISVGDRHTVALLQDGTVLATGANDYGQCDVSLWTDVVQVECGPYYTVALKKDGTVVATGRNNAGQCDTGDWHDIILLSAGENHTLALRANGTVLAAGVSVSAKCKVEDWVDVIALAAGTNHSVGVKKDGTLLVAGGGLIGVSTTPEWNDVLAIEAGDDSILVLRKNEFVCIGNGKIRVDASAPIKRQ